MTDDSDPYDLDAFYLSGAAEEDVDHDTDGDLETPLFSVTSAAKTVTATVYLNGRLHRVELSPHAVNSTERELADEIAVVAEVAAQKARAALHELTSALFRLQGQDANSTRELLELQLKLPTPEEAAVAEAALLARGRLP
ncbi:MAG: YbaB/EbfC family nucleoid-associated protein [Actinomycetota bacterium]|nr:YbaB/EbfC family nucleoid-associated protein [Actinomycetota bacterium]